jgi:hypothetical protein
MSGVSKSSLKEMVVIMLSNTILSVSTNTRILRKGALLNKKQTENTRQVLTSRVDPKNTNGRIKLGVNHSNKTLIGSEHLSS